MIRNFTLVKKLINPINNKLDGYRIEENNILTDVPLSESNTDYQAIQEWVAEGNTIQEAD